MHQRRSPLVRASPFAARSVIARRSESEVIGRVERRRYDGFDLANSGVFRNLHEHPPEAYVYALLDGHEVVYVGQTRNLRARLRQHRRRAQVEGWTFTELWYAAVPEGNVNAAERALISALRPPRNNGHADRAVAPIDLTFLGALGLLPE